MLRAIDEVDDIAVGAGGVQGLLRISAPQEFGRMLIACRAAESLAHYPDVKIELQVTDRCVDIIREGYDVAVRMGALNDSELIRRMITDLNWVMVASPSYIRKRGLPRTVEELASHTGLRYAVEGKPCVAFADGTTLLLESRFDTDDCGFIRRAALAGAGIAYLLRVTVAEDLAAGDLVQISPQYALTRIPAYALHAFGKQLPARARLFIEFLLRKAAEAGI